MKNIFKYAAATVAVAAMISAGCITASAGDISASVINTKTGSTASLQTGNTYILGDVDKDKKLSMLDILLIKRHCAGLDQLSGKSELAGDFDCDGKINITDILMIKRDIAGIGAYSSVVKTANSAVIAGKNGVSVISPADRFSVRIDLTEYDLTDRSYFIIDTERDVEATLTPLYGGRESGNANNTVLPESEHGSCLVFPLLSLNGEVPSGAILTFTESGSSNLIITDMYVCADKTSADHIISRRFTPAAEQKTFMSKSVRENTAIRLLDMTNDDKTNTNGGMYHDFKNCKWPTIAVDENDKLYVVASGPRISHVCPFGATVMAESADGGATWSSPRMISNTIMDDRDAGITYLGNGKMLVSYFTQSGDAYLPGGSGYKSITKGHTVPEWAAEWDSFGNPVGGIVGTYVKMLQYIKNTDKSYDLSESSYVIHSSDYGKTWDAERYSFVGNGYTSEMQTALENYQYTKPGTKVPVTSCHGPLVLSDGTLLYAGKVLDPVDQPMDSMAVYTSRDDGMTWDYLSEIPIPMGYEYNCFHELSVAEAKDGTLLCAIRTQPCGDVWVEPMYTVYLSHSYDGGRTWTVPEPTGMDGTPPHVVTAPNGDIIMTYSYRTNPRCIYANVSTDGGHTWSNKRIVSDPFLPYDDMGYPASVVLSDGSVVTVYYGTYHTGTFNEQYSSVLAMKWTYTLS